VIRDLSEVPAEEWDALVSPDDPFTEHAFLRTLETSGSVGQGTGWQPIHVLIRRSGVLVGAAPLYLKHHSYGEYIFDWGWADAAQRAGVPYYPKLTCAVPFTPATGRRLLTGPGDLVPEVAWALIAGLRGVAKRTNAQSIHLLFITEEEHALLQQDPVLIPRLSHQFHWTNKGYQDFDDWLSHFRSRRRKVVRRERRAAAESGTVIRVLSGSELTDSHWAALHRFYQHTVEKKGAHAYLSPDFFYQAREQLHGSVIGFFAEHAGIPIAGALAFQRGAHLYGRYWGCDPGWERLHFELCYHLPIDLCIDRGWHRFEAGAQGIHKIQRGLMPAQTWSIHQLAHPGLARAVRTALVQECTHVQREIAMLEQHGPFRRSTTGPKSD
jgi:predicted N-acyltransferase